MLVETIDGKIIEVAAEDAQRLIKSRRARPANPQSQRPAPPADPLMVERGVDDTWEDENTLGTRLEKLAARQRGQAR